MRVVLAEDHPQMQQVISSLLAKEHEVSTIVGRGDEIMDAVTRDLPEALVLDVSLPGCSGLQVLPCLRKRHPRLGIIVLTTHSDPVYQLEAQRRGADDYLLKMRAFAELLPAIQRAVASRAAESAVPHLA